MAGLWLELPSCLWGPVQGCERGLKDGRPLGHLAAPHPDSWTSPNLSFGPTTPGFEMAPTPEASFTFQVQDSQEIKHGTLADRISKRVKNDGASQQTSALKKIGKITSAQQKLCRC